MVVGWLLAVGCWIVMLGMAWDGKLAWMDMTVEDGRYLLIETGCTVVATCSTLSDM
jgi:hypothetical protein